MSRREIREQQKRNKAKGRVKKVRLIIFTVIFVLIIAIVIGKSHKKQSESSNLDNNTVVTLEDQIYYSLEKR